MEFETARGARQAEAIVSAALRCLARDGYAATSLQDIADEAGTSKRMVHYYFETRERLFAIVAKRVGDQLIGQIREAIHGLRDTREIVGVGVDRWWDRVTGDSATEVVYFGLLAESMTDPDLKAALASVNDGLRALLRRQLDATHAENPDFPLDEDTAIVLIIALIQGLKLEYLERGQTEALDKALGVFKDWLVFVGERGRTWPRAAPQQ